MNFSITISHRNCQEFINYWKKRYSYGNDDKYEELMKNNLANDADSLRKLFVWKNNNMNLSPQKQGSIDEKIEWLESVKECGEKERIKMAKEKYLCRSKGGAIWNIFFLHCLARQEFPIYDQHTFRSMKYLKTGEFAKNETSDKEKYKNYITEYVPFLNENFEGYNRRDIDKALFTFGKFLKILKTYKIDS